MAQRQKVQISITSQAADDSLSAAGGASVELLRVGATINESDTIEAADLTIDVYTPGQLTTGDIVSVWDTSAGTMGASTMDIASIVDNGSDWTITFNGVTGADVVVDDGDRLVLTAGVSGHRAELYEQELGGSSSQVALTLDSSGQISRWVASADSDVDIYVSGTGLTAKWFLDQRVGDVGVTWEDGDDETIMQGDLDLGTNDIKAVGTITATSAVITTLSVPGSSLLSNLTEIEDEANLNCKVVYSGTQTVASDTTVSITSTANLIAITGTTNINKITTCDAGRKIYVYFTDVAPPDLMFNVSNPNTTNGEFQIPSGNNLSPVQYQVYELIGITISGSDVWAPIGYEDGVAP